MLLEDRGKKNTLYVLILVLFAYIFLFYNLGSYSLKEPDEGRYAEIPREMVEQGDYLVPHLNYVRYFEKPPLLYWVTAASYRMFGISEWSARFPNALAGLLCILMTYFFAARRFGEEVGFLSSLMLMSSFGFFAMSRIVTTDMLFACLLSAALFCFYEFYLDGRRRLLNLFFVALALAVLAKGPVAIILMGGTIFLFLLIEKRLLFLREMATVGGFLLFAAIAAPWFVLVSLKEQGFFQFFFVDQHILRFLTTKHRRSGPMYYFVPVLFGGLFPWSVFLPRAIWRMWRAKEMRLFLIWSAVVFIFFSISGSKLPPYILPILPALCIVLGCLFEAEWDVAVMRKAESVIYLGFFACLAFAGFVLGMNGLLDPYISPMADLASLRKDIQGLSFGLSAVSFALVVMLLSGHMRSFRLSFVALTVFSLSVVVGIMVHAPVLDRLRTTKALAQTINEIKRDSYTVFNLNAFDETLPFYLRQRIYLVEHKGELEMGAKYPDSKQFFVGHEEFLRAFQSDKPAFVVFKEKRLAHMGQSGADDFTLLGCRNGRCLAANRPAARWATKSVSSEQ